MMAINMGGGYDGNKHGTGLRWQSDCNVTPH